MTILFIVVVAAVLLVLIGSLYSRFLARNFGEDPSRPTPAILKNDGRDYVPTPTGVVFGHHFASIAGAGPIVGPVLALSYGWLPALFWVLLGGLFIGAVHDYLAAFMSMRNDGQSMATIARRLVGRGPSLVLMLFLVLCLALITATFLNISATALVSTQELGRMKIPEGQTLFRTVMEGGEPKVVLGGIASTSVIIITLLAPLMGWMYIKKQIAVWKCSLVAIVICTVSIIGGLYYPVNIPDNLLGLGFKGVDTWKALLSIYVLMAAGAPVWMFLQSRDFINVHILYAGVIGLFITLVVASLRAGSAAQGGVPEFDGVHGGQLLGTFWPAVFITVACGAVSGFHSLCAGGTTCKQLKSEAATRHIGYWGMLLETFLAVAVVGILVIGSTQANYLNDVFPRLRGLAKMDNPNLGFAMAVGNAGERAFGLPIAWGALAGLILLEGFVITTLDTAVRLARYLIEEIWAELFGRYDVFAEKAAALERAREANKPAGAGGVATSLPDAAGPPARLSLPATGAFRSLLRFLNHYWVNSGIAVGLMLYFSVSSGILELWKIFATSNQLLATFVLGLGTIWLLRNGRRVWYIALPALFMLATTSASLIQMVPKYLPRETVDAAGQVRKLGNPTLFAADLILIGLTAYLVFMGVREALSLLRKGRTASPAPC
jgi:carbon starvation protein